MWDEVYAVDEYVYGKNPNDFLKDNIDRLKEGNVLCLAEGEGRNAVYLARQGFDVTAVDSSLVGLGKTRALARENGVEVNVFHSDLAEFRINPGVWDNIISIFCHLPPILRRKVHQSAAQGLREGGVMLLEAYTPKQLDFATGGPPSAEMMYTLETLKQDLQGLEFIHQQELVREVVEGTKHHGTASVVQVIATRSS